MSARARTAALLALLMGATMACGGGRKANNRMYTVDETAIVGAPLEMRQGIIEAQQEMDQADNEIQEARGMQARAENDVTQARFDIREAQLKVDRAEADYRLDEQSRNPQTVRNALANLRSVRLGVKVAEAREEWARRKLDAAIARVKTAQLHKQAAIARYEQEKARVVAKGADVPRNFSLAVYDSQASQARLAYDNARVERDKIDTEVMALHNHYMQLNQQMQAAQPPPADGQRLGAPGTP